LDASIKAKEELVGHDIFNLFLRQMYLRNIDKRWVEHLDTLEEIKDAAGLQSYAQKNPLVEYKKNAIEAYDDMLEAIKESVCRIANTVRINANPISSRPQNMPKLRTNNPQETRVFDRRQESIVASQAQSANTTIRRSTPKIGRNDPCPCGSGKKYKNCCGRNL